MWPPALHRAQSRRGSSLLLRFRRSWHSSSRYCCPPRILFEGGGNQCWQFCQHRPLKAGALADPFHAWRDVIRLRLGLRPHIRRGPDASWRSGSAIRVYGPARSGRDLPSHGIIRFRCGVGNMHGSLAIREPFNLPGGGPRGANQQPQGKYEDFYPGHFTALPGSAPAVQVVDCWAGGAVLP